MNSSSYIANFWVANPAYHIPITPKQKAAADKAIYEQFYDYDYESETLPGRCIFLDQFQRHFQRILGPAAITEEQIRKYREEAADDVDRNADELICYKETELVACLMPFKHLGRYEFIFEYLHNTYLPDMGWSSEELSLLKSHPILARFYADTYRKAFNDLTIPSQFIRDPYHPVDQYDAVQICESDVLPFAATVGNSDGQLSADLAALADAVAADPQSAALATLLADAVAGCQPIVSLSGGVDSMVALTLLKARGCAPVAVHIIYGNRGVSSAEYSFIATYCKYIQVPLIAFEIPYIRRDSAPREFYEAVTRELRFATYRVVGKELLETSQLPPKVILGHIKDDLVENVWTNFAKGQHLDNLAKMEPQEEQLGVTLLRPLLAVPKTIITDVAASIGIPYLKNTTPSWSNRGKFREHFYAATQEQYGEHVDDVLLKTAATLKAQSALIEKLLYERIYRTWVYDTSSITVTDESEFLDAAGWHKVFEHICHKFLHISKPSIHSVREFQRRLNSLTNPLKPTNSLKINMKKDLQVIVDGSTITFRVQ
jgi:tRNA(Ile)-lysidine synthase TilS/MesJ